MLPRIIRNAAYTDTFTRKTLLIEADLLVQVQALSSSRKGEQTRIINAALAEFRETAREGVSLDDVDSRDMVRKTFYIENSMKEHLVELARMNKQTAFFNTALRTYLENPKNIAKHSQVEDWYAQPQTYWKNITIHTDNN